MGRSVILTEGVRKGLKEKETMKERSERGESVSYEDLEEGGLSISG